MNTRRLIAMDKKVISDSAWSDSARAIPKKHFPIYPANKPSRAQWRALHVCNDEHSLQYVITVTADEQKAKYRAYLQVLSGNDWHIVSRLETDLPVGGLHAHANCDLRDSLSGPDGISNLNQKIPDKYDDCRENKIKHNWSKENFYQYALKFYCVSVKGDLL